MTTEDGRRLRRWRRAMLVVCALVSLFGAVMVFGLAITLGDPDAWGPGEQVSVLVVAALAAAVGVATGVAAYRLGARLDATVDTAEWLPANRPRGKASRGGNAVSLAWTKMLRDRAWRAVLIGFACLPAVALGAWWNFDLNDSAARLLQDGIRVPGHVAAVWQSKGNSFLRVYYGAGGRMMDYTFRQDSDVSYVVGQAVTVVYDPADPTRIRTLKEKNVGEAGIVGATAILAGFGGMTWSVIVATGWLTRHRRARLTGWREVNVVRATRLREKTRMLLVLEFADRSVIVLRPTSSSAFVAGQADGELSGPVFVSGTDRAMTVLVPREGKRPQVIAAGATDRRGR